MILSQIISRILRALARPLIILPLTFLAGFLVLILLILTSCSTSRHIQTIPVETLRHDTLYINKQSYDSIYIDNRHLIDRGGDTVYIKDKLIEYRYRFLRDAIRITKVDSIPYEVCITETKEVRYIPPWFKFLSLIGGISILLVSFFMVAKLKHTDLI